MITRAFTFLSLSVLFALPCRADEFCDTLTLVVRDASQEFVHVRGNPSTINERYDSPLALPGAFVNQWVVDGKLTPEKSCSIFPVPHDQKRWRYVCEFPYPDSGKGASDVKMIREGVSACLRDAHENLVIQQISGLEDFRAETRDATIVTGTEVLSDAGGLRQYIFVDQKVH